MPEALIAGFASIEDPRCEWKVEHQLGRRVHRLLERRLISCVTHVLRPGPFPPKDGRAAGRGRHEGGGGGGCRCGRWWTGARSRSGTWTARSGRTSGTGAAQLRAPS